MNETDVSIFRAKALRRHSEAHDRSVLPRMVSTHTFLVLWLLLASLGAAVGAAWFVRTPEFAVGPATVVVQPSSADETRGDSLVALLPAAYLSRLHVGQTVFLVLDGGAPLRRSVQAVEPDVLSPSEVRTRFGLDAQGAMTVSRPVAVLHIEAAPFPSGLPASAYVGSSFDAKVEVGSRRLASLVPLAGRLLGG